MIGWIGFVLVLVGVCGLTVFALSGAEWCDSYGEFRAQNREWRDLAMSMHEASKRAAARHGGL